jgi:hypothetical protein
MEHIFVLSPAQAMGKRAAMLMRPEAQFDLAKRARSVDGAPLGEVFSFLSGLYFRGKLTYARRFGIASRGLEACYVITSNAGLVSPDLPVTIETLARFAAVPIDPADERYAQPLRDSAIRIQQAMTSRSEVILLGSIATSKYLEPLLTCFGDRLMFPTTFVGRGDMSRGGLLLRAVASETELQYQSIETASQLRGSRPAKLIPLPRSSGADRRASG